MIPRIAALYILLVSMTLGSIENYKVFLECEMSFWGFSKKAKKASFLVPTQGELK